MVVRTVSLSLLAGGILAMAIGDARGQQKPPAAEGGVISAAVDREVQGLTAVDFPEREAAIGRLKALIGEQVKQRAEIQAIVDALNTDLAKQERALAMVTDEEAVAQVAGLLEMESGLAHWTMETMGEPVERRKALLAWGLGTAVSPVLARTYSEKLTIRLDGVKRLAALEDEGASWTLSRLINDHDTAVRAAAMAAVWNRKPQTDVVAALWYRGVSGPLAHSEQAWRRDRMMVEGPQNTLTVDFPEGDPLEFTEENDGSEFYDALLAGGVLVHLKSPLVGDRIAKFVAERSKAGKLLVVPDDYEFGLVTHRLVETYEVKEAIPMLAMEALGTQHDDMGGDMNGRPFMWSQRTMAIGVLAKLVGKDPADFQLIRVRNGNDPRGWIWATDLPQGGAVGMRGRAEPDGAPVRAFSTWWREHYREYGVKEEPSVAAVPADPGRGGGRGGRGRGAVDPLPGPMPVPGGGVVGPAGE